MRREVNQKGKRKLGFFVHQENGVNLYVAIKAHAEIDKGKRSTISDAKRDGLAGWAIDLPTLMKARKAGVKYVVVKLRKKRQMWVTRFENYMNPAIARLVTKGKSASRILPLDHFVEATQEFTL
jgi:hypothetical protein